MNKEKEDRICEICGDKAKGYNYTVLTCVSCKSFFRRNALSNKLTCLFKNNCEISKFTRKFCTKCRLDKCFALGMDKELIITEEERLNRKELLSSLEMKNKTKSKKNILNDKEDKSQESTEIDDQFLTEILGYSDVSEEEIAVQVKELEESISDNNDDNNVSKWVSVPVMSDNNCLNEMEGNRLQELLTAVSQMDYTFGQYEHKPSDVVRAACLHGVNMVWITKKLVNSFKELTLFNQICPDDQLALVKYGALEVGSMRQIVGYDMHNNHFRIPGETPNTTVVINVNDMENSDVFNNSLSIAGNSIKVYYNKFIVEWDFDHTILSLMTAIVVFNPNRPQLKHPNMIRYNQYVYVYLLQRYLQFKYGSQSVAKTKRKRLLNTLRLLKEVYKTEIQLVAEAKRFGSVSENPLIKEIFTID